MGRKRFGFSLFITLILMMGMVLQAALSVPPAGAEEKEKKVLPPRAVSMALEYTGVIVPKGDDVSVDLKVINGGRSDEDIDVVLTSVPDGWKGRIKTYSFEVTGVHLESDSSKSLTFKAEPDKGVGPGDYLFAMKATTADGKLTASARMTAPLARVVSSTSNARSARRGLASFETSTSTLRKGIPNLSMRSNLLWTCSRKRLDTSTCRPCTTISATSLTKPSSL